MFSTMGESIPPKFRDVKRKVKKFGASKKRVFLRLVEIQLIFARHKRMKFFLFRENAKKPLDRRAGRGYNHPISKGAVVRTTAPFAHLTRENTMR